jgi:hypothetical protein
VSDFDLDTMAFSKLSAKLAKASERPTDPVGWAKSAAGIELWSRQREIAQSVVENKRTAVPSGHGVGKSFLASTIACWWGDTHPVDETFIVTTAPSKPQIHGIVWQNMMNIHEKADLPGDIQMSDNWVIGKRQIAMGRKPHDYNKHSFQGIHRRYVLVVIDEACGVNEWLWNAIETITTGEHCRILAIGNPDDPSSYFAKVCKPGTSWNVLPISVFDSPNFTGEPVSERLADELTSRQWVEDAKANWGEDSAIYTAKVLGQFPDNDPNATIPLSWVRQANQRYEEWVDMGKPEVPGRFMIGADVARFGTDKTVFQPRKGNWFGEQEVFSKQDTEVTADKLMNRLNKQTDFAAVDVIGIGAGVVDKLKRNKYRCHAFNAAARTDATDMTGNWQFQTMRSAAYWHVREILDPSNDFNVMIAPNDQLTADLTAPRWTEKIGAKIYVEAKDDIKKRIGRSTDRGDAFVIAAWYSAGVIDESEPGTYSWTEQDVDGGGIDWDEPEFIGVI